MKTVLFSAAVSLSLAVSAGTWYVDALRPDDSGDGRDPATAKRTIQAAVKVAEESGETELTVLVAPGTYAEGSFSDSDGAKSRVVIKKKLMLRSTGTRDNTFIVGAKTASNAYGLGADSIRGICVDGAAAAGTVVQGFTFRDGSTADSTSSKRNGGGAVCFNQDAGDVYVKDSAAIDCAATYGGGFRGVIVLRSLVKRCHNNNSGNQGAAMYNCRAYACVIDSCGSTSSYNENILRGDGPYVNCTAVGNSGSLLRHSSSQLTYNFLSMLATRQEFDSTNAGGDYVIKSLSNGDAKFANTITVKNDTPDIYGLLVSPITGDYRPVKGGKAEGFADPQYCRMDWIPETERNLDYYGRSFDLSGEAGSIDCGAVQGVVTVPGGAIAMPRTVRTTGTTTVTLNLFHQVDAWPAQFWIADESADTFAFSFGTTAPVRYPSAAGGFWQTFPQSGTLTVGNIAATARLSVGGENAAYGSIQAAVDAASDAADAYTIIDVAPGEYGPVTIGAKNVRIRSTGGKAVTAIVGVKDDTVPEEKRGCGPNAKRCVTIEAGDRLVSVEGFTLREGATEIGDGDLQDASAAGAFSAKTSGSTDRCQLLDCDIVDCSGYNSAAVWGGWLQRCAISNCVNPKVAGADSIVRAARLSSCVLCENDKKDNQLLTSGVEADNCTVIALYRGAPTVVASKTSYLQGSIVCGGYQDKVTPTVGSVLHDMRAAVSIESGFVTGNPLIANPGSGMFTLLEGSSAIGLWDISQKAASGLLEPWKILVGDFNGQPMEFVDGKVTAGAFQTRYVPKDVYVDAAKADDAGDGLSPETAKRTLAAAMAVAGCGDTVHAAAGTYGEGTMPQLFQVRAGATFDVPARVSVPAKATLVGAGAGQSMIRGGYSAEGDGEPIRCVLLADGATLCGFTVTEGLCRIDNITPSTDDLYASGVLGRSTALVEDCEITECRSRICGGVYGGTFRRCRLAGNWAMSGSVSAGMGKVWENCLFTANRGSNIVADYERIANCTFLYDNIAVGGTRITTFGTFADGAVVCNSALILSPTTVDTPMPTVRNCLLPKISSNSWRWGVTNGVNATDCLLSETMVDSSWTGVPGADYVGMDRGLNGAAPEGTDLAGVQRIQNAVVDIGCREYDWMPTYSAAFSKRGWAEVTATSGTVTNATGRVTIGEGGTLTAKMVTAPGGPVAIVAEVSGSGALSVKVNGVVIGSLSSTVSRLPLGEMGVNDVIELSFTGEGGAAGVRIGSGAGLLLIVQ